MKTLRKTLIWTHRYLGILLSALFLMWFLTGIGMIWSRGMPRLTPDVRLARLSPIPLDQIKVTPQEAAEAAGAVEDPGRTTLLTVLDRPAYRFSSGYPQIVFADNGEAVPEFSVDQARTIAARFVGASEQDLGEGVLITEPDQWTLNQVGQLPFYRFEIGDAAATEVYVSAELGEVVNLSTRNSRVLSWFTTIPHFLYFRSLRLNGALWNDLVVWAASLGCVLALVGIVIGFLHFKRPLPYSGWMRWHYVSGLVFGVLTLTWVFSGLLSMEPWDWTTVDNSLEDATREAFPTSAGDLSQFAQFEPSRLQEVIGQSSIKEIEFASIMDEPYYIARSADGLEAKPGPPDGGHQPYYVMRGVDPQRWVVGAKDLSVRKPFEESAIRERLHDAAPSAGVVESAFLTDYDTYYYSRDRQAPLPVLRLKLSDPDHTWLYIDPQVNQVVGRVNTLNRVERWLYNGLHTLDFSFLYYRRPLWDGIVIALSLGGAFVSGMGLLLGIKRVVRAMRRTVAAL